jgi:hypothetical protein
MVVHVNLTSGTSRLKDHAENAVSDEMFEKRFERWPEEAPNTKEAYYIRDIFDSEIALLVPSTPFVAPSDPIL